MNKSILLSLLAAITLLSSPLAHAFDESATQSLVAAVVAKNLPAIEDALRSNANPDATCTTTLRSGTLLTAPVLHTAIGQRNTAAIILLLANGANHLLENSKGDHGLKLIQILLEKNPSCATLLNIQSLLVNPANALLLNAARRGDIESADTALKAGANIEARDGNGNTPLILAALSLSPELVELLLEKGANSKAKNNAGQTALALLKNQMTQRDKEAQDQALKRYEAAWSSTHQEPTQAQLNLALQAAARWDNVEVFKRLVSRGADLNTLTHSSISVDQTQHRWAHNTLLHLLASNLLKEDRTETERAAIIEARLQIATIILFDENNVLRPIAPTLLAARNAYGNTALHFAAMNGHVGLVSFLLTAGAEVTLANNAGQTPLEVASTPEIRSLLQALTPQVIMEGQEDEDPELLAALQASLEEPQPHPLSNASAVGSSSSSSLFRIPSPNPSGASCSYDPNQGPHSS